MGNCLSKELAHSRLNGDNSDSLEIIKKVSKSLLLEKERLVDLVYSRNL